MIFEKKSQLLGNIEKIKKEYTEQGKKLAYLEALQEPKAVLRAEKDSSMNIMLLIAVLCSIVLSTGAAEYCYNGGFTIVDSKGIQNYFCHGTSFFGPHYNIPCPLSLPTECITI